MATDPRTLAKMLRIAQLLLLDLAEGAMRTAEAIDRANTYKAKYEKVGRNPDGSWI